MKLRPLVYLSLANLLLAVLLCALHPHGSELGRLRSVLHISLIRDDSSSFMQVACQVAGQVSEQRQPVYQRLFFDHAFKFIYPPSALLTCGVASALHLQLVTLINLLALASVAATLILDAELFLLLCPVHDPRRRWAVRAFVASLGVLFSPLLFAVYLGQMQAFLDLLFTLAVWAWVRGDKRLAGLSVALVCCFKPPLAFFFLWALLRREWRFLGWFAGASVLLQGIALWRFGWVNAGDYLRVLAYLSHHGEVIAGNQSVNGLLERWAGNGLNLVWTRTSPYPPYNAFVYRGTVLAWASLLGFGLMWPVLRRWQDSATDFLLFGLLATVASPIAWTHHYGLFYAGCIYFVARSLRERGTFPWWFGACFLVLANTWPMLDALGATRWNPLVSYDLFAGLGVIAALIWSLQHSTAPRTTAAML